jgi:hypothetical protein
MRPAAIRCRCTTLHSSGRTGAHPCTLPVPHPVTPTRGAATAAVGAVRVTSWTGALGPRWLLVQLLATTCVLCVVDVYWWLPVAASSTYSRRSAGCNALGTAKVVCVLGGDQARGGCSESCFGCPRVAICLFTGGAGSTGCARAAWASSSSCWLKVQRSPQQACLAVH